MMDKVKHQNIDQYVNAHADHFPSEMANALDNMIDTAVSLGSTIDWTTLSIEHPSPVYARDMAGQRTAYTSTDLLITVDSIIIEENE